MPNGFDFGFTPEGEITVDDVLHDIKAVEEIDLKVQLAYNRIKSIAKNWFVDECGANLEYIIGKPCNEATAEYGKELITQMLILEDLWDESNFHIKAEIISNTNITYNIFLKDFDRTKGTITSYEIIAELDLVKGVYVRYGWEPRR